MYSERGQVEIGKRNVLADGIPCSKSQQEVQSVSSPFEFWLAWHLLWDQLNVVTVALSDLYSLGIKGPCQPTFALLKHQPKSIRYGSQSSLIEDKSPCVRKPPCPKAQPEPKARHIRELTSDLLTWWPLQLDTTDEGAHVKPAQELSG